MNVWVRVALRLYPPSFRERYGAELAALADDLGPSCRHRLDLFLGAARAWLLPSFSGRDAVRARLQASVSTVWVAWCAGFLLVPAMAKALLDPAGPHTGPTVRALLLVADAALVLGTASALLGAGWIAVRALLPAVRSGQRSLLLPLLPVLVLALVEGAGAAALAVTELTATGRSAPAAWAGAWVAGLLVLVTCAGIGPALTIHRLRPQPRLLRLPGLLALVSTACLVVTTGASVAAALIAQGEARLVGSAYPVVAVIAVGVAAAASASVSSARAVVMLHGQHR